jgi:predicted glycoside hydrolase/deacetylase ChbG (UPF0249 family)
MKYLIVSADDFGLVKSLNDGIIKSHEEGIVTSISVLPTGYAFDEAVGWLKSKGVRDIGVHLNLTAFSPVSPPHEIQTLVTDKGSFLKKYQLILRLISGLISLDEVHLELNRQIEKVREAGLDISHLDSHEHIHMLPPLLDIFIRLAKRHHVKAMRRLQVDMVLGNISPRKLYRNLVSLYFGRRTKLVLMSALLESPNHLYGFVNAGRMTEEVLLDILRRLPDGLTEIVCHPGFLSPELLKISNWHVNCEDELYALTSRRVKKTVEEEGINLTTYQEYIAKKPL